MNESMNNNYNNGGVMPTQGMPVQQPVPVQPVVQMQQQVQPQMPVQQTVVTQTPAVAPIEPTVVQMEPAVAPIESVQTAEIQQGIAEPAVTQAEQTVVESVVVDEDQSGDGSGVTFDYNEIYGVQSTDIQDINPVEENKPIFEVKDVVIDEKRNGEKVTSDITPEFNMQALDGTMKTSTTVDNNVLDEKEADRADTRRKIIYIGVISLLLIIAVKFIFPILNGYNL